MHPQSASGIAFAKFCVVDSDHWLHLSGVTVTHTTFGEGRIVEVKERPASSPLFTIDFANTRRKSFNSDGFKNGVFSAVHLPHNITDEFYAWHVKHAQEEERAERVLKLAEKYNISINNNRESILISILEKLDARLKLETIEIAWLEGEKIFRVLATYFYRQFANESDLWHLVKACKYLRTASMPQKVIDLSARELANDGKWDQRALAALLTVRGGAFRDVGDLESGIESANRSALLSPNSPHAHNLLGALYMTQGNVEEGEGHFDIAVALGSRERARNREYISIMKNTSHDIREKIAHYLLGKDRKKYSWVARFIPSAEA